MRLSRRLLTLTALGLIGLALATTARAATRDAYLAGYATAVLEREFGLRVPSLDVREGTLRIAAADLAGADRDRVVAALTAIKGVARVEVLQGTPAPSGPGPAASTPPPPGRERAARDYATGLMPGGLLFEPLIADPRWPHFSLSWQRYIDHPELENVFALSFGESFALYRGRLGRGWWEAGLQAGVHAIFDLDSKSSELINSDYIAGGTGSYRQGPFSALARLFHQSSHLGDEFVLRSRVERVNLSYEGIEAKLSWDFERYLRVYGGAGYLYRRDPPDLEPWSLQEGFEFRGPPLLQHPTLRPVAGVDLKQLEQHAWATDLSVRAGLQLDGVLATRNLQLLFEYFRGHSPNGQFFREMIEYLGLGFHFHF